MITLLISHGVSVDHTGRLDPQITCTVYGGPEHINLLVENGAAIVGSALLQNAVSYGNVAITSRLLELGVDHEYGIDRAAFVRVPELMQLLLERSVTDVEQSGYENWTPLLWVLHVHNKWTYLRTVTQSTCPRRQAERCAERTARLLIEFGADVLATNKHGESALHLTVGTSWDQEIVELLLQYGADPNAATLEGKTVLDGLDVTQTTLDDPKSTTRVQLGLLLEYGAKPFVTGNDGRSTLDRLQDTTAGQSFVVAHPSFFRTN